MSYDALLVLSFGGPEGADDVMPFLHNVTRGRGIPEERLQRVAKHYEHFHGVSPLNARNRELIEALRVDFAEQHIELPIYWGNRNWRPYVADAVRQMRDDGVRSALVFTTSGFAGYSSCRQYRDDLAQATAVSGKGAPELVKLRHFFDHPGYIAANVASLRQALATLPESERDSARLIFTAHSTPQSMNENSGPLANGLYERQQRETARLVTMIVRGAEAEFDLAWQSRSGDPKTPWLEPDINDHLRALAEAGVTSVVVCPTGFVADHMEVVWDLDVEARGTAEQLGITFVRAATVGVHPAFIRAIRELVGEQLYNEDPKMLSSLGLCGVDCPRTCCAAPKRGAANAPKVSA